MRSLFALGVAQVGAVLISAGVAFGQLPTAQTPSPASEPLVGGQIISDGTVIYEEVVDWEGANGRPARPRPWANGEYLLWWVKDAPINFPLVTTGDPNNGGPPNPGALSRPDTSVLFGNDINYGEKSGGRVSLGGWSQSGNIGFEVSGFWLENANTRTRFASDAVGNPPIYIPFFDSALGRESSNTVADVPFGFAGDVTIESALRFWGTEANGLVSLLRRANANVDLILGVRYLSLEEDLRLTANRNDLLTPLLFSERDSFETRNRFLGGQVGAKLDYRLGRLRVDALGKLGLGSTHQTSEVKGSTVVAGLDTFAGGNFTAPSNIGRQSRDEFSVVPQVQVKVGYDILPRLTAFAGYDFIYWTNVARPGDQMDRSLNQTQLFGGALVGEATPATRFENSDFWAHGVTFGFELRY